MRRWALGLVTAAVVSGTGCATLGRQAFQEPVVTFKDARIVGLGVTGGSLEVVLDVYNPNHFRLDGTGLTYKVLVDSTTVGEGEYNSRWGVEQGDRTEVRLPISFTYAGLGAAGRKLTETGSVEYNVVGDMTVTTPLGRFTRPYDQKGRFSTLSGASR